MTTLLRGTALRYVLTHTLTRNGRMTVTELAEELARLGSRRRRHRLPP